MRGNARYAVVNGRLSVLAYNVETGRVEWLDTSGTPPYAFAHGRLRAKVEELGLGWEWTDLREPFTGKRVVRWWVDNPRRIPEYRDKRLGYDLTYEADIPYVRRLMHDGVLVPRYGRDAVVYVDIEVDDSQGFPEPGDEVLSIAYSVGGGETRFLYSGDYDRPSEMLAAFIEDTVMRGATVFVAWNAGFDWEYLSAWLKRNESQLDPEHVNAFTLFEVVDLLDAYRQTVKGLSSYSLLEVAKAEGLNYEAKEREKRVSEMSRRELEEYNTNDVELIKQIDAKYRFTDVTMKIAEYVRLTVSQAFYADGRDRAGFTWKIRATRVGDALLIERARELGYVLPNTPRQGKAGYQGAYVHTPVPGLYERVAVFDVESMYPNIIVNYKIDAFTFDGRLLPVVQEKLLARRRAYKRLYKELGDEEFDVMQWALKILANSLYGLFGTEGSRILDEGKAAEVTRRGRELLQRIIDAVEARYGVGSVVYGDTDSVFVDLSRAGVDAGEIERFINERIAPFRVKLEYEGKLLILSKKRYVLETSDGEWVVRGVELRRGDWDAFTKMVVEEVVKMIFAGKGLTEIREWLRRVKADLYSGRYDGMLVITKGINPRKEYKNDAEHVRAWRLMGSPKTVDRVHYVYVKTKDRVMPLERPGDAERLRENGVRIDYGRYWDRVEAVVNRLLKPLKVQAARLTRLGIGGV